MEYVLDNGTTVPSEIIEMCKQKVLKAIEDVLPQEFQMYELYLYILKNSEEELRFKRIIL